MRELNRERHPRHHQPRRSTLRRALSRHVVARCPLRRPVHHRRALHRHLLSAELPGDDAETGQCHLLSHRRRRARGGPPRVQALPARRRARLIRLENPRRSRGPGHAVDCGWRRRAGRCPRPRQPAGLYPQAFDPRAGARARGRTARPRPRASCPDRENPAHEHRAVGRRRGLRGGIRQHPPVQ